MGKGHAGEDGHQRRHQNVHPGLLGDGLAQLGGENGDEQNRQRPACALAPVQGGGAQQICRIAHRRQRKKHQRRRLQRPADGHGHGRAAHGGGKRANAHQKFQVQLRSQRVQNGPDEQRAKQALSHGAHGVDAVAPAGKNDILALEKGFEGLHGKNSSCFGGAPPHFFHLTTVRRGKQSGFPTQITEKISLFGCFAHCKVLKFVYNVKGSAGRVLFLL